MSRRKTAWRDRPLATVGARPGGLCIVAVNRAAGDAGVHPGLPLTTARALVPGLCTAGTEAAAERRDLAALADWCGRYSPWTALDGAGGIWLDVSGCAHLFGGEAALLDDLGGRLGGLGFACVAALADTPGAAWAVARFGERVTGAVTIVPPGQTRRALAPLPVAGLRLPPGMAEALHRLGLGRIGEVLALPRASLAARFGEALLGRLDQALGRCDEPISPRRPLPALRARLAFAEPIARTDDVAAALRHLLAELCRRLEAAHQGARRLELAFYRVDGSRTDAAVGTSRPTRDPDHLERLFAEKLDGLDAGFGIEVMTLAASAVDPLAPLQDGLYSEKDGRADVARLLDRLAGRLGPARVTRLVECASHVPERACREISAVAASASPAPGTPGPHGGERRPAQPRPVHLLPWPEPIEVMAPVPDHPPVMFRWRRHRHRVRRADGPERIAPEWWREGPGEACSQAAHSRDYYRVEDTAGRRFWLYREGLYRPGIRPRWYLHGFFP